MRSYLERLIGQRPWAALAFFTLAYLLLSLSSKLLASKLDLLPALWPVAGLYIAALLITPWKRWPWILLAALAAQFLFAASFNNSGLHEPFGLWFADTFGAVCAAALINLVLRERFELNTLRAALALMLFAVLGNSLLSAVISAFVLSDAYGLPWASSVRDALFANALGVLLVAPLLLARTAKEEGQPQAGWSEGIVLGCLLAIALFYVFAGVNQLGRPFYVLPLLLWAAVRYGVLGAVVASAITTVVGTTLDQFNLGPYFNLSTLDRQLILQPQFLVFGLTSLLVAVLFRQQQAATAAVQQANLLLEARVAERTAELERSRETATAQFNELDSLYRNAPVGLCVLDTELRFVRVNERLAQMNGLPVAAHIGRTINEVVPGIAQSAEAALRAVLSTGKPNLAVEIVGQTPAQPGRTRVWIEDWLPLQDANGKIIGISVVANEVTEERRIQSELLASERRFRQFANNIDAVLWMSEPNSRRLLYASPAYEKLHGRPLTVLYENYETWLDGVHPDDRAGVREAFARHERQGGYDIEYRVVRPDGSMSWVRDRSFAVRNERGEVEYLAGIAEDISDDVEAQMDLADSEHRFRLASRAAQGMVYEWNLATGHVYRSEGLLQLTGFSPSEVPPTAQWWVQRLDPNDAQRALQEFEAVRNDHSVDRFEAEYRAQHRDGHWLDLWDRSYFERDPAGRIRRVVGNTIDISERKNAQRALAASEERFRAAADAMQGMVYEWDITTDRVQRSEGLLALTGFAREEVPSYASWWKQRVRAEDVQRLEQELRRVYAVKQTRFETEFRFQHKDGHWIHILDRSSFEYDSQGQPLRAIGSSVDISERKRTEALLQLLSDVSRVLAGSLEPVRNAEALAALLVPRHADFCVVYLQRRDGISVAATQHVQEERQAALKQLFEDYVPHAQAPHPLARVLAGETLLLEHTEQQTELNESADQREFSLRHQLQARSLLFVPLSARGRNVGVLALGLSQDGQQGERVYRKDEVRLYEELGQRAALALDNADLYQTGQRALTQLQVQDRRKTEFLSMLAHELRNPLTPIRNAAEVLGVLAQGQPQFAQISTVLRRQTHKMARLIDDLLDMARLTHGKVKLERHVIRMADVLNQAAEATRNLMTARNQTLSLQMPQETLWVNADPLRLEQVFINLLSNAAKFGGLDDQLKLGLALEQGLITVRLRDHGQGIKENLLPHVFDLFTQDERTPDRQQGGLGIGLALSRSLIELHGGTIEAQSDGPGKGAEFIVRLPPAVAPQTRPAPAPVVSPAATALRVLVAEDNTDAADTLCFLLRGAGYVVHLARSGPEALAIAPTVRPQVVMLDIGLPGLDGFEVAHRLRSMSETADALIIGISGYGDADSRRKAHANGINTYFVKPLDLDALLNTLSEKEKAGAFIGTAGAFRN